MLLFTVALALEPLVAVGLTRLVGPRDLVSEWMVFGELLVLAVGLIVEPVRVALVAAAYDRTLARLTVASVQLEPQQPALGSHQQVEDERTGAGGDDEDDRHHDIAPVRL